MAVIPSASPAPPATPAAPAQAPFGGSPAVTPSRNPGFEVAGKQKVAMALKILTDAFPLYGATSDEGQVILDCMRKLGKVAQPGDVSQAGQMNVLQALMLKAAQNAQARRQLAAPGGPGAAPGAAASPAPATPSS